MSSRGNPAYAVRFCPIEKAAIKATVDRINERRAGEPLTVADWIRDCVNERLKKLAYRKKIPPAERMEHEQQ